MTEREAGDAVLAERTVTRVALFDIDGTILRAGDRWHAQAFEAALNEVAGLPLSLNGVPLAGMLDSQIARIALEQHGFPPDHIDPQLHQLMAVMGERYRESIVDQERRSWLLPGAVELAGLLNQAGYVIGVLTGNAESVARAKLEAAGVAEHFPYGAYGDTARERFELVDTALSTIRREVGQDVTPQSTVLIGDTPRDIEAARESGARVVAVATGRFGVDDLAAYGPDVLAADLTETDRLIAAIDRLT